jgi:hypothetical protein
MSNTNDTRTRIESSVRESAERRTADAVSVPELWALAEQLSKGSFSAPRTVRAIYRELLIAYQIGYKDGAQRVIDKWGKVLNERIKRGVCG